MEEYERIAQGNTAEILRRGDVVYKVFAARFPKGEAAYEAEKQRFAHAAGLPVPEVLEVTQIDGRQAIAMEYVAGETYRACMGRVDDITPYLERFIQLQQRIHAVNADGMESAAVKIARKIAASHMITERQRDGLLDMLDDLPAEQALCHGDYHVMNVLEGEGDPVIIDWVDAGRGAPVFDVCRSYVLHMLVSPDFARIYLQAYCKAAGWDEEAVLRWLPPHVAAIPWDSLTPENKHLVGRILSNFYG